jgi:type IV secretion system protein VirB5
MFKRPSTHYGKSPQPETPYQRAAQVWDDRIGSARVQAKNWRLMAFGSLALSAGFPARCSGSRERLDRALGGAGRSARPGAGRRPGDRRLSADRSADRLLPRALHRAGPLDPGRRDHRAAELAARLRLHHAGRRAGAQRLRPRQRPFAKVGKQQVAVEVSSVIRASPTSFRVAWIERRYQDGRSPPPNAGPPSSPSRPAAARRRHAAEEPARIYVNAINWSKELGQ